MEKKFLPVVDVIYYLNRLGCTYKCDFIGSRLYIEGLPSDCGILLGLLCSKVNSFAFYPCDKGIEVLYLGE